MVDSSLEMNGSASADAIARCTAGIDSYVRWRADAMGHLDASIAAEGNYALPRLVKGWMLNSSRDASFTDTIDAQINAVESQSGNQPAMEARERRLFVALKTSRAGDGIGAATLLEQHLVENPTDALAQQLIQNELFWMGRADWMHDVAERSAPAWSDTTHAYSSFLSLRAFANEEAGDLAAAERFGRMAVEIDPEDTWGAHAVAHVLLMRGDTQPGIEWLEGLCQHWGHANQLRHHLWWHLCLFLLEQGEYDKIKTLLTTEVRNPESALVQAAPAAGIDIQNFASLLLRLELYGVNVSDQWQVLETVCAERVNNHGNAFCNIHDMMVLCATGQFDLAAEMIMSMRERYHRQRGSVALAYQAAGIPACEAIMAYYKRDYDTVLEKLSPVRHDLSLLGASHAQRDVLYHLLMHAARQQHRDDLQQILLRDIERIGFCDVPERAAYKQAASK